MLSARAGHLDGCVPRHREWVLVMDDPAVDSHLDWQPGAPREQIEQALHNHVLDEGSLLGYDAKSKLTDLFC